MTITVRERELAAVGISVAAGCKPCTDYHVKAARKARVSDHRIRRAIIDALEVRRSATAIMSAHALAHVREAPTADPGAPGTTEKDRTDVLVSMGAAFAVNCVSSLEIHLADAKAKRVAQEDVAQVLKLAAFIKERAASHVERLIPMPAHAPGEEGVTVARDCGTDPQVAPHA